MLMTPYHLFLFLFHHHRHLHLHLLLQLNYYLPELTDKLVTKLSRDLSRFSRSTKTTFTFEFTLKLSPTTYPLSQNFNHPPALFYSTLLPSCSFLVSYFPFFHSITPFLTFFPGLSMK